MRHPSSLPPLRVRCFRASVIAALATALAMAFAGCWRPESSEAGSGSGGGGSAGDDDTFQAHEESFDALYEATPIDLEGSVIDEVGMGLPGATASVLSWDEDGLSARAETATDAQGGLSFSGLPRRAALLRLRLKGHYDEIVPLDLARPLGETTLRLGPVPLVRKRPGLVRLVVGGDVMFGRRFVDADEDGIEGEPGDLIRPGSRAEDARALLRFVKDVLAAGDFSTVNLETPVSENPATFHPLKEYVFFSHPETLEALKDAGVDAVSLGNNHVYDLLEEGMRDTIAALDDAGIPWFGAGMSLSDAARSVHGRTVNGAEIALQGFCGIIPGRTPPWPEEMLYVARDPPAAKGGALELTETNLRDFLREASGRLAVPVMHAGVEYSEYPNRPVRSRARQAIAEGATFVAAHHPHTVQGIAVLEGGPVTGFAFLSLGNLLFDQQIFETSPSFLGVVDVELIPDRLTPEGRFLEGGHRVRGVRLVPIQVEGYVPKLLCGDRAARLGRHVAHLSTHLPPSAEPSDPPDGLVGATVFPTTAGAFVALHESWYETGDRDEELEPPLAVRNGRTDPVPFRRDSPEDFLRRISTAAPASVEYGRDLLIYGDFEDLDVDDVRDEGSVWWQSPDAIIENSVTRGGASALALLRSPGGVYPVATWVRNRISFRLGTPLTLAGHFRGDGAGIVEVQVRWYDPEGRELRLETPYRRGPGTYGWEPFAVDLSPPGAAAALRIYLRQFPPAAGKGWAFADDLALIGWEGSAPDAAMGVDLPTPNNWAWLRFRTLDRSASTLSVRLTHRTYRVRPPAEWTDPPESSIEEAEAHIAALYEATPIDIEGSVIDEVGMGLPGATASVLSWDEDGLSARAETATDAQGGLSFSGLPRRAALLRLRLEGHYDEIVPLDLARPLGETSLRLGAVPLVPRRPGLVRFVVGGDVMFGRRFMDADEDGIEGEPGDLIRPGSRAEDARALLGFVEDVLAAGDFTTVNLESPVTDDPATPHPLKAPVQYSHPETIAALVDAGVDAVSLANDHAYDYLAQGFEDTLRNLDAEGLRWYGAGRTQTDARSRFVEWPMSGGPEDGPGGWAEGWDGEGGGFPFVVQGFCGFKPAKTPPWEDELLYIALDDSPVGPTLAKGGALYLTEGNVERFFTAAGDRLAVPIFHSGSTYSQVPGATMRKYAQISIEKGAALVAGHHPHVLQGIAVLDTSADGDPPRARTGRIAFLSLGNILGDSETFETFQSAIAVVDVLRSADGAGYEVSGARLLPIHLERFVPRLLCGERAARLGRHVGHLSTLLNARDASWDIGEPGARLLGAVVFPGPHGARVVPNVESPGWTEREAPVGPTFRAPGGPSDPVPFPREAPSEFLAGVRTDAPSRIWLGRDLLIYGDFEDLDVDDEAGECLAWVRSAGAILVGSDFRGGRRCLLLLRRSWDSTDATVSQRNRIRFGGGTGEEGSGGDGSGAEGSLLTLVGHMKARTSGTVNVVVWWYSAADGSLIDAVAVHDEPPGTFDWKPLYVDLHPPVGAGYVRIQVRHRRPERGEGRVFLDDLAIVQWEALEGDAEAGIAVPSPNDWGWLRFAPEDPNAGEPGVGELGVTVTHRTY